MFEFVFEASEGFVEFFNTVLKVLDVGVVVNWCFNCAFFNGCWCEILNNWAFLNKFDFIFNTAYCLIKFRIV